MSGCKLSKTTKRPKTHQPQIRKHVVWDLQTATYTPHCQKGGKKGKRKKLPAPTNTHYILLLSPSKAQRQSATIPISVPPWLAYSSRPSLNIELSKDYSITCTTHHTGHEQKTNHIKMYNSMRRTMPTCKWRTYIPNVSIILSNDALLIVFITCNNPHHLMLDT